MPIITTLKFADNLDDVAFAADQGYDITALADLADWAREHSTSLKRDVNPNNIFPNILVCSWESDDLADSFIKDISNILGDLVSIEKTQE